MEWCLPGTGGKPVPITVAERVAFVKEKEMRNVIRM
jgi:hypothetical protein